MKLGLSSKVELELTVGLLRNVSYGLVPVGSVLLYGDRYKIFLNGRLISYSDHAEQRAITWVTANLGNYRAIFTNLRLLTTKEPCEVCKAALLNLGLRYEVIPGSRYQNLMGSFFKGLRG